MWGNMSHVKAYTCDIHMYQKSMDANLPVWRTCTDRGLYACGYVYHYAVSSTQAGESWSHYYALEELISCVSDVRPRPISCVCWGVQEKFLWGLAQGEP
jgi:hypothetical protein